MFSNVIKARWARAVVVLALATTAVPGSRAAAQGSSLPPNNGPTGCQPTASTPVPQPTQAQLDVAGLGDLPLAPASARPTSWPRRSATPPQWTTRSSRSAISTRRS